MTFGFLSKKNPKCYFVSRLEAQTPYDLNLNGLPVMSSSGAYGIISYLDSLDTDPGLDDRFESARYHVETHCQSHVETHQCKCLAIDSKRIHVEKCNRM